MDTVYSFDTVVIAPGHSFVASKIAQEFFEIREFRAFGDRLERVRVLIRVGVYMQATGDMRSVPLPLFMSSPEGNTSPIVLECSRCGAPAEKEQKRCTYCAAPFTWRPFTALAYAGGAIQLGGEILQPGMEMSATFENRGKHEVEIESAFVGWKKTRQNWEMAGYSGLPGYRSASR
jgi:hypothetical protein